ncbi:MAG TPA: 1,4-alpha-glucan branching protein GlgB [Rhizomicrobium sp.]
MPDLDLREATSIDRSTADSIAEGRIHDPFAVLGPHDTPTMGRVIRAYLPGAIAVRAVERNTGRELCPLHEIAVPGLFEGRPETDAPYYLRIDWPHSGQEMEDPYSFGPVLEDMDVYLFSEGSHWKLAEQIGAAPTVMEGIAGVRFAVWAPNARRVAVVGDFNNWDGRRHPMRLRHGAGLWELFIPRLKAGERYKFEIRDGDDRLLPLKADPLARATELPPATASVVAENSAFAWSDEEWMAERGSRQAADQPMSIYEIHAGSWMRPDSDAAGTLDWDALGERLIPYVIEHGFTHIELMPIMEHPFTGSWGYQPLSQFAPSARYGPAAAFARMVDLCHRAGVGVILDWVPGHFPSDAHGLARFDGTALYEHADPREGFHPDWSTYVYNFGRREVRGFLIASALYWLERFHVDGLRVDAVASMIYRDYSRKEGEWIPNRFGGRENLEAIEFLKRLNTVVRERCPGAITIAEESTAWPGVTAPVENGGLGFFYKWNMGWMHDTLSYISREPVHRIWHHEDVTFGLVYAFSERFVLPLSHDEVVHGKGSLYGRIAGTAEERLATLRAYFAFMWTHPGKKLLFMGGEIGQPNEWNHDGAIPWRLLDNRLHAGLQKLVADLNRLYRSESSLHARDSEADGFEWIVGDDARNSVFVWLRRGNSGECSIVALNMTPVGRDNYRIGLPEPGRYREVLNTDAEVYGGANRGNLGGVIALDEPSHGRPFSARLYLPPLSAIVLKKEA